MIQLSFTERVVPYTFDRAIRTLALGQGPDVWPKTIDRIVIDLSHTEFADFSALAQIALLVENAARRGIPVEISVPSSAGSASLNHRSAKVQRDTRAVANASRFMEHCGFYKLLELSHIPDASRLIRVHEGGHSVSTSLPGTKPPILMGEANRFLLSRIFSFAWLHPMAGSELARSENYARAILGLSDLGLADSDAEAIASTVLNELIENVFYYAQESGQQFNSRPFALVGAILLDPKRYRSDSARLLPFMRPFLDWAEASGSPIIRLVVGDSGIGIPAMLGPNFDSSADRNIGSQLKLSRTEQILLWSFNKWSTSDLSAAASKRGTRGLWRVERFVRSYRGLIAVRSADALVGFSYEDSNQHTLIRDEYASYMPGTLLDIYLLPKAAALPHLVTGKQSVRLAPKLSVIRCRGEQSALVSNSEQSDIIRALRGAHLESRRCVAVSIERQPQTNSDIHIALELLSSFANHGEVVALFPRRTWRQLEAAVESFDLFTDEALSSRDAASQRFSLEPIRIFDATGDSRWVGGNRIIRKILNRLSLSPVDKESLRTLSEGGELPYLNRLLNDQPDLIEFTDNRSLIRLRMTAADINNGFCAHRADLITDVVKGANNDNVYAGLFRTPTLGLCTRWLNGPALIEEVIGFPSLAYCLAWKLRQVVRVSDSVIVIYGESPHLELAQAMSACLSVGSPHAIPSTFSAVMHPEISRIPIGAKVVCCTDVILTENTMSRVVAELLRSSIEVIAIVSAIDGRLNRQRGLFCLGIEIPIVSLAAIDVCEDSTKIQGREITEIDALLRTPITVRAPAISEPRYQISPNELGAWCTAEPGVLCLGHIERSNWRHFPVYLNAGKLLQSSDVRERILGCFATEVQAWQAPIDIKPHKMSAVEIWYPGPEPFAKQLAQAVHQDFKNTLFGGKDTVLKAIPRAEHFGSWDFPMDVPHFRIPTEVLIVDWGSLTATTTEQMMRLAAQAGAKSVLVLIFLSQMPSDEEMFLRQIAGLKAVKFLHPSFDLPNSNQSLLPFDTDKLQSAISTTDYETIPARVAFLSSLQIKFYAPSECPICVGQDKYIAASNKCAIENLREYASDIAARLAKVDRETAFERYKHDLFGAPIEPGEILKMLEWRSQLYGAIRSTAERNNVVGRIHNLTNALTSTDWAALVRLLAAEPTWLKIPPLNFAVPRQHVATLARKTLTSTIPLHPILRQESLSLLRDISQEDFIDAVPEIFRASLSDSDLRLQLLYEIFTYLQRSYRCSAKELDSLDTHLHVCAGMLENCGFPHLEHSLTIRALIQTCQVRREIISIGNPDLLDVWHLLRQRYLGSIETHADVIDAMRVVKLTAARPPAVYPPDEEDWLAALAHWDKCCTFLATQVLPYLVSLDSLIGSEFYSSKMTPVEHARLRALASGNAADELHRLTQLLYRFSRDPSIFLKTEIRQRCTNEVDWWYGTFLKIGPTGPRAPGGALFLQLVRSCPSNLIETIQIAKASAGRQVGVFNWQETSPEEDLSVFCDSDLLTHTFAHLIDNACDAKHAIQNRAEEFIPTIAVDYLVNHQYVTVTVRNDGTEIREKPGKGLERIQRDLGAFGTTLSWRAAPLPWTFEAEVKLRRM